MSDGGPAFPADWGGDATQEGMSLRDYFAAKAMQGFAADSTYTPLTTMKMADTAYVWADAMLKARKAQP